MTAAPIRLAVLGDPLRMTRSPELHRAGLASLGLECESVALRTPREALGATLARLAADGYRGVNLTIPLKEAALDHVARVSDAARRARSINTVGFDASGWWGDTTDGVGFVAMLRALGHTPSRERVVLLGAGGSARSVALALLEAGCDALVASARTPDRARLAWLGIPGADIVAWRSREEGAALARATLVVNATPLSGSEAPIAPLLVGRGALAIDLRYDAHVTEWVSALRAHGLEAYDGLGLLAFQARQSLALWMGREVAIDPLARALGWPR